ncbi:serine/threonine-protein kinase/endoribonuclease IRE1a-like isoform X2 [Tripterygium wilfordii]|uniref:serine/threonine-protein kinase/endoribonuclease IRE1a-like isoform X2 n=1 Tax=Tripterygium wilfordii TaxID=458696 RepID=UPI0018F84D58|nr:serine/threonine-protein kinase/endoribonuclease IRE1a-like isoform X2 [Tripterygium wilfordii]
MRPLQLFLCLLGQLLLAVAVIPSFLNGNSSAAETSKIVHSRLLLSTLNGDIVNSETAVVPSSLGWDAFEGLGRSRTPTRSLLSKPETVGRLVATLDGRIHLHDGDSGRVFWSFSTGQQLYSSYQAHINQKDGGDDDENVIGPNSSYFLDCGDNMELYAQINHYRVKLPFTVEDYIQNLPYISDDGAVTIGSKTTTVFEVETKTGKLIQTYGSPITFQGNAEGDSLHDTQVIDKELVEHTLNTHRELRLHITRTDYTLQHFAPKSKKVSWSLRVAEIGVAFLCQGIEDPFSNATLDSSYVLHSEIDSESDKPLSCQSKRIALRFQKQAISKSSTRTIDADMMFPSHHSTLMLPSQLAVNKSSENYHETMMLPASQDDQVSKMDHKNDSEAVLRGPPLKTDHYVISQAHDVKKLYNDISTMFVEGLTLLSLVLVIGILLGGSVFYVYLLVHKRQVKLDNQLGNSSLKVKASNRKKVRRSGKNNSNEEKKDRDTSPESGGGFALWEDKNQMLLDLNRLADSGADGRIIGKLFVTNTKIAKGSNGTVVLEGLYEGRLVAVKRLVQAHHEVAFKEIQNLIASDQHPNIVRWYGVEYDQDFVYLCLERCSCSLDDLIQIYSDTSQNPVCSKKQATNAMIECKHRLEVVKDAMQDLNLWKANGFPSPILLNLMRDVVSGLVHLHELGIIHRDLKPPNVLIIKERSLLAKLSDMGISKRLVGDMSSLGYHATGCGSSGWQAPEQLLHGRQTRAVDMFSLGCVLFYCITAGRHPFGNRLERDINIVKNQMDLFLVEHIPEAWDLISCLLNHNPELSLFCCQTKGSGSVAPSVVLGC